MGNALTPEQEARRRALTVHELRGLAPGWLNDQIYQIESAAFPDAKRDAYLGNSVMWIGEDSVEAVLVYEADGRARYHIRLLAARPEAQNQGLGTLLLKHAVRKLGRGITLSVEAEPVERHDRLVAYYARRGFEAIGVTAFGSTKMRMR